MPSASDELDSAVRCIELGAEDYLPKPIDAVLLRARIGACLDKKRLHDQEQQHLGIIERQAVELADWNQTLERRVTEQTAQLERVGRLKRFLPARLAEAIIASGDESLLASHRRQIAIVFCDLRGFTRFSERAEPEEVMEVLAEHHTAIGALISHYEGTVEHFAGDGLMVVFNGPVPLPGRGGAGGQDGGGHARPDGSCSVNPGCDGATSLASASGSRMATRRLARLGSRDVSTTRPSAVWSTSPHVAQAKDGQILVSRRIGLAIEDEAEVASLVTSHSRGFRDPVPVDEIVAMRQA